MTRFLEEEQQSASAIQRPSRTARVQIVIQNSSGPDELYELIIDLEMASVTEQHFLEGKHSFTDAAYMEAVEKVCMSDEDVQKEIRLLELPSDATVIVEPWTYATDGMNDMSQRTSMVHCQTTLLALMV